MRSGDRGEMTREKRLQRLLNLIPECRVLVVGDLMLDDYRRGHVDRISPEAPVPILRVVGQDTMLGGAGNVVKNLRSLEVEAMAIGVLGVDDTGEQILEQMKALGVSGDYVVRDVQRVSTRKVRYVSMEHGQQVFRADEESTQDVSGEVEDEIIRLVRQHSADAQVIVCSDYLKGVLTARVLKAAFETGRERKIPVIVAPKDGTAQKYDGADILMPNVKELSRLVGTAVSDDSWLSDSAERLTKSLGLQALLVTRGKDGMTLFESNTGGLRRVNIPTAARNVYDVTGAGDTSLAAFAAGIAAGAEREAAARLANVAASIVVGKRGTASASRHELREQLRRENLTDEMAASSALGEEAITAD